MPHGAKDPNRERRSLTLLFLRRGEKKAARGVDGVDGVAGALVLPATISSSVWHDEEEGSREEIKENSKWSTTKRDEQDPPKERDRRCDDEHSKMQRRSNR